ncbi:MAG: hypothetical protein HC837_04280 [Chloroflexaceae bacterium]|nr:hypothetical protein [Chloroflexaceae bacterium]
MASEHDTTEYKHRILYSELEAANALNRKLMRQLKQAQAAAAEASRAHAKMVATLTETMRENTALTTERDLWKARAMRQPSLSETYLHISHLLGIDDVTEEEVRVIRKAIARLHHPDTGGDAERMKAWNVALDRLDI